MVHHSSSLAAVAGLELHIGLMVQQSFSLAVASKSCAALAVQPKRQPSEESKRLQTAKKKS
jgi:hypothetical protein